MNPYLAGALLGVGGTLLAVLGAFSAVDNRYVSRREYDTMLFDIRQQLTDIKGALGIGGKRGT